MSVRPTKCQHAEALVVAVSGVIFESSQKLHRFTPIPFVHGVIDDRGTDTLAGG